MWWNFCELLEIQRFLWWEVLTTPKLFAVWKLCEYLGVIIICVCLWLTELLDLWICTRNPQVHLKMFNKVCSRVTRLGSNSVFICCRGKRYIMLLKNSAWLVKTAARNQHNGKFICSHNSFFTLDYWVGLLGMKCYSKTDDSLVLGYEDNQVSIIVIHSMQFFMWLIFSDLFLS